MKHLHKILMIVAGLALSCFAYWLHAAAETGTTIHPGAWRSTYAYHTTETLSLTFTPGAATEVSEVRVHLGAVGGAGSLTIAMDHATTSGMDVKMDVTDMTALADRHWVPTRPIFVGESDSMTVTFPNAGGLDWGAEVVWRRQ